MQWNRFVGPYVVVRNMPHRLRRFYLPHRTGHVADRLFALRLDGLCVPVRFESVKMPNDFGGAKTKLHHKHDGVLRESLVIMPHGSGSSDYDM